MTTTLLIRISDRYPRLNNFLQGYPDNQQENMTVLYIYESTRGVWRIGERRNNAVYAFAVAEGVIREAYLIEQWYEAGTTQYTTRNDTNDYNNRWEFTGTLANENIRKKYVGMDVSNRFVQGNANPINYWEIPEN